MANALILRQPGATIVAMQASPHPPTSWRHWLPPYVAVFAAIGLLRSLSALQSYQRSGGTRAWEPVLWESSSVLVVALLLLALYRWVQHTEA